MHKGFTFPPLMAQCLKQAASSKYSNRFEADIVREAVAEWLSRKYPKLAMEYNVVNYGRK